MSTEQTRTQKLLALYEELLVASRDERVADTLSAALRVRLEQREAVIQAIRPRLDALRHRSVRAPLRLGEQRQLRIDEAYLLYALRDAEDYRVRIAEPEAQARDAVARREAVIAAVRQLSGSAELPPGLGHRD